MIIYACNTTLAQVHTYAIARMKSTESKCIYHIQVYRIFVTTCTSSTSSQKPNIYAHLLCISISNSTKTGTVYSKILYAHKCKDFLKVNFQICVTSSSVRLPCRLPFLTWDAPRFNLQIYSPLYVKFTCLFKYAGVYMLICNSVHCVFSD